MSGGDPDTPESLEAAFREAAAVVISPLADTRHYNAGRALFYAGVCAYAAIYSERCPARPRDPDLDAEVDIYARQMSGGRVGFRPTGAGS